MNVRKVSLFANLLSPLLHLAKGDNIIMSRIGTRQPNVIYPLCDCACTQSNNGLRSSQTQSIFPVKGLQRIHIRVSQLLVNKAYCMILYNNRRIHHAKVLENEYQLGYVHWQLL